MPRHSVTLGRVWWWAQNWARVARLLHCCHNRLRSSVAHPPGPELSSREGVGWRVHAYIFPSTNFFLAPKPPGIMLP